MRGGLSLAAPSSARPGGRGGDIGSYAPNGGGSLARAPSARALLYAHHLSLDALDRGGPNLMAAASAAGRSGTKGGDEAVCV